MSGRREQICDALFEALYPSSTRTAIEHATDAVLAALGDADTAQADAWDAGWDAGTVFADGCKYGSGDRNPYRAVVGDRAAAEGRDT